MVTWEEAAPVILEVDIKFKSGLPDSQSKKGNKIGYITLIA